MQKKYDIIVAGCGCAGFAAAVQAGRLGKNVLIIEKNGMPGGIMTVGGNNDVAQFYAHQNQIIAGIGWEFVNLLKEEGGAVIPDMHKTGVPHWYYGVHVNIPLAAAKMDEMLLDAGVDICYEQFICAANVESDRDGKKIRSILVTSKSGLVEIGADKIVKREELKETLAMILKLHKKPESGCLAAWEREHSGEGASEENRSRGKKVRHASEKAAGMIRSAWDSVLLSRKSDRPVATDYIHAIFDDFMEFHGDRYCKDDGAIVGGIASFHGMPVTVIGQEKGKNTKENIKRNFGMPSPDGYRKALRLMKQAETFGRPVVCFVDTPGAFCGLEAEERGQGEAIARNLFEMSDLTVPVLSIVIGEGGSGGALAMAVANEVWMMENAVYSVLSPEGFASILWKDSKRADEAARVMKMTAKELKELGIIERVIPEPEPADPETLPEIAKTMEDAMEEFFETWTPLGGKTLAERRYERFRKF